MCVIDRLPGDHFVGDISDKAVLEAFAADIISRHGRVDVIVNISSSRDRMSQSQTESYTAA